MTEPKPIYNHRNGEPAAERRLSGSGPIPIAGAADGECHPAGTGENITVTMPANSGIIASSERNGPGPSESPTSAERNATGTIKECHYCGEPIIALRPHKRFCSSYCRQRAWLAADPERAAEVNEKSKARLRAHMEARGREWVDGRGS